MLLQNGLKLVVNSRGEEEAQDVRGLTKLRTRPEDFTNLWCSVFKASGSSTRAGKALFLAGFDNPASV